MAPRVPPPVPYYWRPDGARSLIGQVPKVGTLLAWRHEAWRVVAVDDVAEVDWTDQDRARLAALKLEFRDRNRPRVVVVRPARITGDDPRDRDHDLELTCGGARSAAYFHVYEDAHYPVCVICGEPTPCREVMAGRQIAAAAQKEARYDLPGICPGCSEPVTSRQRSITFEENLVVALGPPVTFHLRRGCRSSAAAYEKKWLVLNPGQARRVLSCPGHVTNHNDGTYECSEFGDCPGPAAEHPSYSVCRCPDCHARGTFGCSPAPDARLLDRRPVDRPGPDRDPTGGWGGVSG